MKKWLLVAATVIAAIAAWPKEGPSIDVQPAVAEIARVPAAPPPAEVVERFDAKLLAREREIQVQDLFGPSAPPPQPAAPPAAAPQPVAAPSAPALPFTYLGRMKKGAKVIVYLQRNQEMVLAEAGAKLDGIYLVESISPTSVDFVYLPLQVKQALNIPPP